MLSTLELRHSGRRRRFARGGKEGNWGAGLGQGEKKGGRECKRGDEKFGDQ